MKTKFNQGSVTEISSENRKKYSVNASLLNMRHGPASSYDSWGTKKNGELVTVYAKCNGWGRVSKENEKWMKMSYLKQVSSASSDKTSKKELTAKEMAQQNPNSVLNQKVKGMSVKKLSVELDEDIKTVTKKQLANAKKDFDRYKNTFGAPFTFTPETDPQYFSSGLGDGVGRVMLQTIYSNPTVFSIMPGKVNYLPKTTNKERTNLLNGVVSVLGSSKMGGDASLDVKEKIGWNGSLFNVKSAYNDYINRFNAMARTSAVMMGIGEHKMPGTNVKLADYDYRFYTTTKRHKGTKKGIFTSYADTAAAMAKTAMNDDAYIHFFLTHQGSSVSEQFSTSTTESVLQSIVNEGKLDQYSKQITFLFNGQLDSGASADVDKLLESAEGSGTYGKQFAKLAVNYLKGGRMVIPEMIDSFDYKNAVQCRFKFVSLYGDPLSIFLNVTLPIIGIMCFMIPKQIGENMYTYPYIVKCFQKGWYNTDLAVMQNLELTRGGADDISWTVDSLATEVEASFDIIPLYSSMMSASSRNPFLFMSNTALLEYLGNICGLDLKLNTLDTKISLLKQLYANSIKDIPISVATQVGEGIGNSIKSFFSFDK